MRKALMLVIALMILATAVSVNALEINQNNTGQSNNQGIRNGWNGTTAQWYGQTFIIPSSDGLNKSLERIDFVLNENAACTGTVGVNLTTANVNNISQTQIALVLMDCSIINNSIKNVSFMFNGTSVATNTKLLAGFFDYAGTATDNAILIYGATTTDYYPNGTCVWKGDGVTAQSTGCTNTGGGITTDLAFNVVYGDIASNFTITLNDSYNGSAITNFNASVTINGTTTNYTTTNGTITANFVKENNLANITITSNGYHSSTYQNYNVSSNLAAVATQIFTTITAYNGLTNATITSFNISTAYINYTTTNGSVIANLTNGTTHNISIVSNGFISQTTNVSYSTAPSNQTLTFYLYPSITIRLFNETDGSAFNPNITTSTILQVFCENSTQQQTLTATTNTLNTTCAWDIMRVYVTFNNDTYYRTLKPDLSSSTIDFYLINLLTDTAVQKTFLLNDLTGTYGDGTLIFDKIIGTSQVTINQDDWDIEDKVIAYFILYDNYIVELTDNENETRILGPFIADATSSHTISVPTIPLYTDNTIDDFSWGYILSQENNWLYMNWQSIDGTLAEINYTIVNASNTSQIFYTNTFNTTTGSVNFTTLYNNSIYKTMLTFTHSSWSTHTDTKTWGGVFLMGDDFAGFSNIAAFKMWFAIIAIIVVALLFNGLTTSAAAIWVVAGTTLFNWIGWLNMPTLWIVVMGVFALMIAFIAEGVNR